MFQSNLTFGNFFSIPILKKTFIWKQHVFQSKETQKMKQQQFVRNGGGTLNLIVVPKSLAVRLVITTSDH